MSNSKRGFEGQLRRCVAILTIALCAFTIAGADEGAAVGHGGVVRASLDFRIKMPATLAVSSHADEVLLVHANAGPLVVARKDGSSRTLPGWLHATTLQPDKDAAGQAAGVSLTLVSP